MSKKRKELYRIWVSRPMGAFHAALCVLAMALYIAAGLLKAPALRPAGVGLFLLDALSFAVHTNQSRMFHYVNTDRRTAQFPQKQMRRRNNALLLLFLLICAAAASAALLLPYQSFTAWVKDLLYRSISALLLKIFQVKVYEGSIVESGSQSGGEPVQWKPSASALADAMEQLMVSAALVVALLLVCWLLYYIWCRLAYYRRKRSVPEDMAETAGELRVRVGRERKQRLSVFDSSPNAQVRRRYIRALRAGFGKNACPGAAMTPTELESCAGVVQSIGALHELYLRARYSEKGCTKEELRACRDAGKR